MPSSDDIREALMGLSSRTAAAVAVRAAMRVLPVLAQRRSAAPFDYWREGKAADHSLAILRCYQASIFGNSLPKIDATVAADSASDTAYVAAAAADANAARGAATVARAAAHAAAAYADAAADAAANAVAASTRAAAAGDVGIAAAHALQADLDATENTIEIAALLVRPLWPHGAPSKVEDLWRTLENDFRSLDAGFDVWIDWYQDRLDGKPLDLELERKWFLLPKKVLAMSASESNAVLTSLRAGRFETAGLKYANLEIPEIQEPGLQFAPQKDGKIGLKPSGFAPPDDVTEILAMRGVIVEALDDLTILLDGSNAYNSIATVAQRYKSVVSDDKLSVDLLYAYGVRLENARTRLEREIKSGDFPDLAVAAGEALDSIIALHGPVVYSTARGKELVELARAFGQDPLKVSAYKPTAQQVAMAIDKAREAVTELAREAIKDASDEIGEGKHPERSTQVARTALANFMIAAAKGVQKGFAPETVVDGVKDGIKDGHKTIAKWGYVGGATAAGIAACTTAPALLSFFIANQALLHQFSAVAGCELSWLPSFLNWLERQRAHLKL